MHRLRELIKDVLILILTLAIVVLALFALPTKTLTETPWLAAVLQPFAGFFGVSRAELAKAQTDQTGTAAAMPIAVSVKNEAGRCSSQYDFSALDSRYELLGGQLAKALSAVTQTESANEAELQQAVSHNGVVFRYAAALPVQILAQWLGCETTLSCRADFFVLCESGDTLRLYLSGDELLRCETAAPSQGLSELIGAAVPDGSFFAFEQEEYRKLDPFSLLSADAPQLRPAKAQNPCDSRFSGALASSLGFNPYGDTSYTDNAGNVYFSETNCLLKIENDGFLQLDNSDAARFSAESADAASQIEAARALVQKVYTPVGGDARLYLSGFEQTADGAVCRFDYVLGGTPVSCGESAAVVTLRGKTVVSMQMQLRKYTLQNETLPLLPPKQAAVISKSGAALRLGYADTGAAELSAGWLE